MHRCQKTILDVSLEKEIFTQSFWNVTKPCISLSAKRSQKSEIIRPLEQFFFSCIQDTVSHDTIPHLFFAVDGTTPILKYVRRTIVYEKFFLCCYFTFCSNSNYIIPLISSSSFGWLLFIISLADHLSPSARAAPETSPSILCARLMNPVELNWAGFSIHYVAFRLSSSAFEEA